MSRRNRNQYQSFNQGRQNGWGIGLYRHPSDGWFGGVCAGLADYWEVPTWVHDYQPSLCSYSPGQSYFGFMSLHGF